MSKKTKTILFRFGRALGATLVAALAAFLVGPEAAGLVPSGLQFVITTFLVPVLLAGEKALRYGGDPGESRPDAPGEVTD